MKKVGDACLSYLGGVTSLLRRERSRCVRRVCVSALARRHFTPGVSSMRAPLLDPDKYAVANDAVAPRHVPADIKRPPHLVNPNESPMTAPVVKLGDTDLSAMRDACGIVKEVLDLCSDFVRPGVTTDEIDELVHNFLIENRAYPACLGYMGFPKSCCTSVNEVVCHGIPNDRPLQDGDIVNVDIVAYYNGFHGDASRTFCVGDVDDMSRMLVRVTEEALNRAIDSIGPGVNLTEVGRVIEELVDSGPRNYGIVREFTGHGLGARLHMLPHVFHFKNQSDWILQPGTTLTIEPMLSEGSRHVKSWADGWTIATNDGGRSAQFEHVVLITEDGTEVLT